MNLNHLRLGFIQSLFLYSLIVMTEIIRFFYKLNSVLYLGAGILLILALSAIIGIIAPAESFRNETVEKISEDGALMLFLFGVFVGPLVETLIFQALPYLFLRKLFKHKIKLYLYLIISSILFGLTHNYNLIYCLTAIWVGLLLSFFYYVAKLRKENAVLYVFTIHGCNNFISLMIYSYL